MGEICLFSRIAQKYRDSTVVVIGGGGIGGAIIDLLSSSAGNLVVADRDAALLKNLEASVRPARLLARQLDVRDSSAVAELFVSIKSTVGTPDFLFYTAGILNIE